MLTPAQQARASRPQSNHITNNKAGSGSGFLIVDDKSNINIDATDKKSDIAISAKSLQRQAVAPNKGQFTRAETRKLRVICPRV